MNLIYTLAALLIPILFFVLIIGFDRERWREVAAALTPSYTVTHRPTLDRAPRVFHIRYLAVWYASRKLRHWALGTEVWVNWNTPRRERIWP